MLNRVAWFALGICFVGLVVGCSSSPGKGGANDGGPSKDAAEDSRHEDASHDAGHHLADAGPDARKGGGGRDASEDANDADEDAEDADEDANEDAGDAAIGCTYTISGSATGSGTCTVSVAFNGGELSVTFENAAAEEVSAPLTFAAHLGTTSDFAPGTFTQATTAFSAGEYVVVADVIPLPPTGDWLLCYRPGDPCAGYAPTGPAPMINNVGTFTLDITSTGPQTLVPGDGGSFPAWQAMHGTLTATYVAQQGSGTTGSIKIDATF
jgi:hypothetical protein